MIDFKNKKIQWILANTALPAFFVLCFRLFNPSLKTQQFIAFSVIILILILNIYYYIRLSNLRKKIVTVTVLNIIATFFVGALSLFTGIPLIVTHIYLFIKRAILY